MVPARLALKPPALHDEPADQITAAERLLRSMHIGFDRVYGVDIDRIWFVNCQRQARTAMLVMEIDELKVSGVVHGWPV